MENPSFPIRKIIYVRSGFSTSMLLEGKSNGMWSSSINSGDFTSDPRKTWLTYPIVATWIGLSRWYCRWSEVPCFFPIAVLVPRGSASATAPAAPTAGRSHRRRIPGPSPWPGRGRQKPGGWWKLWVSLEENLWFPWKNLENLGFSLGKL